MVSLRTGNRRRRKAQRIDDLKAAFDFDLRQMGRVAAMRQRHNSGFVRRWRKRQKVARRVA